MYTKDEAVKLAEIMDELNVSVIDSSEFDSSIDSAIVKKVLAETKSLSGENQYFFNYNYEQTKDPDQALSLLIDDFVDGRDFSKEEINSIKDLIFKKSEKEMPLLINKNGKGKIFKTIAQWRLSIRK